MVTPNIENTFPNTSTKTVFSAIQPTNTPHLGNYLGALKNWVDLQNEYNCIYAVADLHAITLRQNPPAFRKQIRETYTLLIAMGIDTNKTSLFIQSHNHMHAELSWALSCFTAFGELSRMTQFKDKSQKHEDNINAGLFTYPVLQAADILIYNADFVPVGADQKQHLELSRDIAVRFNNAYSDTFVLPEPLIPKAAAKIMSLSSPDKKMSKSDENPNASVSILDDKDTIIKKFRRAVTDSHSEIRYDNENPDKAGINNLITIYSVITGKQIPDIESEFSGKGYGDFKTAVGEAVADSFTKLRDEYSRLSNDKAYVDACMKSGAEKSMALSKKTLSKVYKKIGFI